MNTEQERALLPCPFCGGTNIEIQISTPDREGVPTNLMCSDCGASGPWEYEQGNSHAKADDAWNRRAALQSQPQETIAYMTRNEEGDRAMLFFDLKEARLYCSPDEEPEALVLAGPTLQSQEREAAFCVWHNDPETDNSWDTGCRKLFELYDGTPSENRMSFCCYCGKIIREAIDHARRIEGEGE